MTTSNRTINEKLSRALMLTTALTLASTNIANAQDVDPEIGNNEAEAILIDEDEDEDEDEERGDVVIVTGSRIKRDTFSSISPLQVISTELSQDIGLFDPSTILQRSEAASGQQIDATFQGFVLDNGPGSQTLNLRGLGASRTLLLLNGRRLAPAGVEGAPSNPSINLLPGSLIERYDLLLDGASSIYGSDAVAGVGNVILKQDFEGFEVFASGNANPRGGGDDYTINGSWGMNSDRGFIGFGAEYDFRDEIQIQDRDFLAGCDTHYEITETGEILTLGISDRLFVEDRTPGVTISDNACKVSGISGRIFSPFQTYGSVYFQPGMGNSGITDYSESTAGGVDIDANGDGIRDVDFQDVNVNGSNPERTFISEQKRFSIMSYGEYTFEGEANITPFYEALFTRAEIVADNTGAFQLFPTVPGNNPFNPCNLANNDCAAAEVTLLGRTGFNAGLDLPTVPITAIRGDRTNFDVTQDQLRLVGGVRGDLPWMSGDLFDNWSFEVTGTYSRADGDSVTLGIREDKLAFALGIDPSADFDGDGIIDNNGDGLADDYDQGVRFPSTLTPCDASGLANPDLLLPDVTQGCVPVDLFNESVLGSPIGDFASSAERDYVFGTRAFDTVYEQTIFSGLITGNVGRTGAGPIGVAAGFEIRKDEITSLPSPEASNGLFFGFFSDTGAIGEKTIKELFAEIDIPLIANYPFFDNLEVNLSGRFTDEEFYGAAFTYSVKGGWRPVNSLLLKASYGTSFRAPNLRENFLAGQSGFNTIFDPCAVPNDAYDNGVYDPTLDTREQFVFDNCMREGRDPLTVGTDATLGNTQVTSSVEILRGGSLDLTEETSKSFTTGFSFAQPFFETFDLNIGATYYDIEVADTVIDPSATFIVNDCFTRDDGIRSAFCDRITTSDPATTRGLISDIDGAFINLNFQTVRGLDINSQFSKDFTAFQEPMRFNLNLRANHLIERSSVFIGDDGMLLDDEDAGEFGFPKWTGSATTSLDWKKFRFTWQTRYIGDVEQPEDAIDPFSDALDTRDTGFTGNTCAAPIFCRDVGFAGDYFTHSTSIRYDADTWTIRAGISNVFDREPPLVDSNEVFAVSNTPIGNGYDLDGREYFASISKRF